MLQRIQSVFLLLASAAMLVACMTPLVFFRFGTGQAVFGAQGITLDGQPGDPARALFAIGIATIALALFTIFVYKNRRMQIRLSVVNILLMIGFYLYSAFILYPYYVMETFQFEKIGIGSIMPLIAIIFTVLAIRRIKTDENLVRSLNRLRG